MLSNKIHLFYKQCCARNSVYQNKVLVYYSWLIGFVKSTLFLKSEDCANTVTKWMDFKGCSVLSCQLWIRFRYLSSLDLILNSFAVQVTSFLFTTLNEHCLHAQSYVMWQLCTKIFCCKFIGNKMFYCMQASHKLV